MKSRRILFIGDSLIAFFDWQSRFPDHEILNLGIGGETVEGLLSRVERIIRGLKSPDLIFVMIGINNIAMEEFDFSDSYRKIIKKLSAAYPRARIYIQSILPTLLEWISNDSIRRVNDLLQEVARETRAAYIDISGRFVGLEGNPVEGFFLSDGTHLSPEGYAVWAETLEEIIGG